MNRKTKQSIYKKDRGSIIIFLKIMNQETTLEILKMGYNVFLTGPAGSGKTYVLNRYIDYLRDKKIPVAITASTGIAATHLGGRTIHSWSGLGIKERIDEISLKKIFYKRQLLNSIVKTKVLIIDEISMLCANQLDAVHQILQSVRRNEEPFGGIQTIFCGDFFQLPPVEKVRNPVPFAYSSEIWKRMDLKICYLSEQHRQKDNELMGVLNAIRKGSVTEKTKEILHFHKDKVFPTHIQPVELFTHNVDVDGMNNRELSKIPGKAYAYNMRAHGRKKLIEFLRKSCLAPERLILKKGARVMFVKNNFEEGYVNGTIGKIIDFNKETKIPIVRTDRGRDIVANPASWSIEEEDEVIARIKQIPLRLAWAITVHKSQGMSLDNAEIDLGKSFEYGMGYVALSRVRTLEGLSILGINEMAFRVHEDVQKTDKQFLEQSKIVEKEINQMEKSKKVRCQKEFLNERKENRNRAPKNSSKKGQYRHWQKN